MRLFSSAAAVFAAIACIACSGAARDAKRAAPSPTGAPGGGAAVLPAPAPATPVAVTPAPADVDSFDIKVRPLLARTCAPCHIPGGKLYDRLPFDRPEVIRAHRDGVLRRLKGADLETVRAWLGPAKP